MLTLRRPSWFLASCREADVSVTELYASTAVETSSGSKDLMNYGGRGMREAERMVLDGGLDRQG